MINGESADEVGSHYVISAHCHCDDAMCVVSKDKTQTASFKSVHRMPCVV